MKILLGRTRSAESVHDASHTIVRRNVAFVRFGGSSRPISRGIKESTVAPSHELVILDSWR